MAKPIRLFVSSSPELAAEREALGQVAAELPILVGWEIKHTPAPGETDLEALAFAGTCDFFLVILGSDYVAPMGLEWQLARDWGAARMAYHKRVMTSPAAQSLLRRRAVDWVLFDDVAEFRFRVATDLAQAVLDAAGRFGLRLDEVEGLMERLSADQQGRGAEPDDRRGAERGGVILGRGT